MTNEELAGRGIHAKHLLDDEVFQDAVKLAREDAIKTWEATEDRDEQFAAWNQVRAITAVEKQLRRFISDGEYAQALINRSLKG